VKPWEGEIRTEYFPALFDKLRERKRKKRNPALTLLFEIKNGNQVYEKKYENPTICSIALYCSILYK
jgi:hypothetical protein